VRSSLLLIYSHDSVVRVSFVFFVIHSWTDLVLSLLVGSLSPRQAEITRPHDGHKPRDSDSRFLHIVVFFLDQVFRSVMDEATMNKVVIFVEYEHHLNFICLDFLWFFSLLKIVAFSSA
jgi:hypothetical protein